MNTYIPPVLIYSQLDNITRINTAVKLQHNILNSHIVCMYECSNADTHLTITIFL